MRRAPLLSLCLALVAAPCVFAAAPPGPDASDAACGTVGVLALLLFGVLGFAFYIIPTVVAAFRGHPNTAAIAAVNLLLGWSVLGWVAALAWALTALESKDHHHYHHAGPTPAPPPGGALRTSRPPPPMPDSHDPFDFS